jgi:hypothetical protein
MVFGNAYPMTSLHSIVNGRRSFCKSQIVEVGNNTGLVRFRRGGCLQPELHRNLGVSGGGFRKSQLVEVGKNAVLNIVHTMKVYFTTRRRHTTEWGSGSSLLASEYSSFDSILAIEVVSILPCADEKSTSHDGP